MRKGATEAEIEVARAPRTTRDEAELEGVGKLANMTGAPEERGVIGSGAEVIGRGAKSSKEAKRAGDD